ncbi:ComEA family DNA-binding protein [Mumia sp. ZJ430]|uniref:ComEA family DNA-binding protein n=1 Tax=Mumia sp. ZJ430 TaxID=2708083 RepID=UPI001FBAB4FE|nr:ComEA family DNA-binding protein [Mumia sp. ZJ430]
MERRGDRTSEAARRRLEQLARELSRLDARPGEVVDDPLEGPFDDPPPMLIEDLDDDLGDDLFDEVDIAALEHRDGRVASPPARHRAGAASPPAWSADARDRIPPRLRSALGQGTTTTHVLVLLVVLVVAAGGALWWVQRAQPETVGAEPVALAAPGGAGEAVASPDPAAPTGAVPAEVVVDVAGKVRRPGIVTLPAGSRVVDALEAAGGARRGTELTALNLARVLVDGEQIVVGLPSVAPPPGSGTSGGAPSSPGSSTGAVVNLNTATLEQLDTLPQVGPVTAQAILDWRTEHGRFSTVDELLEVDGIGEATLAKLRDLVTL